MGVQEGGGVGEAGGIDGGGGAGGMDGGGGEGAGGVDGGGAGGMLDGGGDGAKNVCREAGHVERAVSLFQVFSEMTKAAEPCPRVRVEVHLQPV